jgi:hypothetical protein
MDAELVDGFAAACAAARHTMFMQEHSFLDHARLDLRKKNFGCRLLKIKVERVGMILEKTDWD